MLTRLVLVLLVSAVPAVHGGLQLGSPFGDHMVLQRDQRIPIWGWSNPGDEVTVDFAGRSESTTADTQGAWRIVLAPLPASASQRELVVTSRNADSERVVRKFEDVLVGDVWLCGGQSNMERQLGPRPGQKPLYNWEAEVAAADHPHLRHLYVSHTRAAKPQATVEATWSVCSPKTAPHFTAVGYYFARDLQAALGNHIPVGIIHSSWGGTPAEAWTSADGLAAFPEFSDALAALELDAQGVAEAKRRYLEKLEAWYAAHDPGVLTGNAWFAADSPSAAEWPTMVLPALWEDQGHDGFDGVGWFRRRFDLPEDWVGQDLKLLLGRIYDEDTTWINGQEIGTTRGNRTSRKYTLPADSLRPSGNVLVVRVLDTGGAGGFSDSKIPLGLTRTDRTEEIISLSGPWSYRLVADLKSTPRPPKDPTNNAKSPTGLYNGMIAPLAPYGIRGVTFYQGEANASRAAQYRTLLPALINDWRRLWHQEDLPFLFVQIAPFRNQPPEIREAQLLAWQATPHSAMAVTIDVGDANDIHPANKEPVGARLALAARAVAYGESIAYSGPVYKSVEFRGNHAELSFTHVAEGLVAPGGKLHGFTLAGPDGIFFPADAAIANDTVIVSAPGVPTPTAVRYGWANVASGNLFNTAGLPASPFRTDAPKMP